MKIHIKRAYDTHLKSDGVRVLVDRLWPRGVSKKAAHIDIWAKELAPSNTLRSWFHKEPKGRYKEFCIKYRSELSGKKDIGRELIKGHKMLTLVTAVKDVEHSHIPTLTSFLEKL